MVETLCFLRAHWAPAADRLAIASRSRWPGVWRTTKDFYTEIRTGNEDPFEFLAGNISIKIFPNGNFGEGRLSFRNAAVGITPIVLDPRRVRSKRD